MENTLNEQTESLKENVVSLSHWKNLKKNEKYADEYRKYLGMLNTSEIILEIQNIIKELGQEAFDLKVVKKAEFVLGEMAQRALSFNSPQFSESINKMREEMQERVKDLRTLL